MDMEEQKDKTLDAEPNILDTGPKTQDSGHETRDTGRKTGDTVELETLLKRVQADFENYKKFVEKEREEVAVRAKAAFAQKLLGTVDELEIALQHTHNAKNEEMTKGIKMLHTNFMKALHSEGLKEIKCDGEKFDPYLHEAVRTQESDAEEGKIIEVMKKGYMFKDKVIRHSMVVVSSGMKK